jgi:Fe-S-cluster containining protein
MSVIKRKLTEAEQRPFTCVMCGKCCRGEGDVHLSDEDIRRIASALGCSPEEFMRTYGARKRGRPILKDQANEDCIFFRDSQCRVHAVKPEQCRKWPFWKNVAQRPSGFAAARSYCDGLKRFDFEEFRQLASDTDLFEHT